MNIESLVSKIELFEALIIKTGFKRDLNDYLQSIQQGQNQNLVFMKDLSLKIKNKLIECDNYGIESELNSVLRDSKPFTELDTHTKLEDLDNDTEIDGNNYYAQFSQIISQLVKNLDMNKTELDSVLKIFQKYVNIEKE